MALAIGSEWHRWDVHIHTPGTAFEDNFGNITIDQFVDKINEKTKDNDVIALGITDYYSINNYIELKKRFYEGKFKKIEFIFPNIEFRLGIPTKNSSALNIHLLISPDDQEHIYHIQRNLDRLQYEHNGTPYSCNREQIIRLGTELDKTIVDEQKRYIKGLNNFRPELNIFIEWLENDRWLIENTIVAVSGNSKDGFSALSLDGGFNALRKELVRNSKIIFSSNPNDVKYYLGEADESEEIIKEKYKSLKPCLTGSDAHSLERLFESEDKRFCWIKAEPSFNGLRQVIFEPKERVFIGEFPPNSNKNQYLSNIRVNKTDWFPNINIPINKGLVSIIGSRGSGKTALLDIISIALNAYEEGDASFISKAKKLVLPLDYSKEMNNSNSLSNNIYKDDFNDEYPQARYLSQQFVEKLCSSNGASSELIKEIENFIFNELDDFKKQDASNFEELKNIIILTYDRDIEELNNEISECSSEITRIYELKKSLEQKNNEILKLNEEIKSIILPQIDTIKKNNIIKTQEEYNKKFQTINLELKSINEKIKLLSDIKTKINNYNMKLQEISNDLIKELSLINLTKEEELLFNISYPKNLIDLLDSKILILNNEITIKSGNKENPVKDTFFWLKNELDKIDIGLKNISKIEREYLEKQKLIQAKQQKIIIIEKQIEDIKKLDIEIYKKKRMEKYIKIFEIIIKKCNALSELYGPLENNLKTKYGEEIPLSLYVKRSVDINTWISDGKKIIDGRDRTKLKTDGGLIVVANKLLLEAWKTGNPQEICNVMTNFIDEYISSHISDLLREGYTPIDLAKWLFSTDHISTPYELKFENVSIEKLSPGTRGVVLLLLFLKVDINDNRPILIDQPEDNLDPASVYDKLVPYFKEARERRQIIMVTHNPNLVVGTDSDQIIIAKSEKRDEDKLPIFNYISGGLENPEIKTSVCNILEGGEAAFKRRQNRYFNT